METHALLLENCEAAETKCLAKILHFFGINYCCLPIQQLLAEYRRPKDREYETAHKFRILCSVQTLFDLIRQIEKDREAIEWWQANIHSVFTYAGKMPHLVEEFVRKATGDNSATVDEAKCETKTFNIAPDATGFCGVMSGISGYCLRTG